MVLNNSEISLEVESNGMLLTISFRFDCFSFSLRRRSRFIIPYSASCVLDLAGLDLGLRFKSLSELDSSILDWVGMGKGCRLQGKVEVIGFGFSGYGGWGWI